MIVAWRLVKWPRRAEALTGEGAKRHPGRWNPAGLRAVYLAESAELAVLEMFVHLDPSQALLQLALIRVDIPDSLQVREIPAKRLPRDWRRNPPPESTRRLGGTWLSQGETPLLRVPSVLVPHATSLILNPEHPQAVRVKAGPPERHRMDLRMWK